ncbi:MAG: hypothetical protein QG620_607 [Patescibacteria group bacterium]|nr:hypothetical protein [Patescibacteria group bacterium]
MSKNRNKKTTITNRRYLSASRGFTLIELLVIVAIIGVLAAIMMVSLQGGRRKAARASVLSSMASVMRELTSCDDSLGEATAAAPTGGTTVVCCADNTCASAMSGHDATWPNISNTSWSYNTPLEGTSLAGGDYQYSASSADGTETIVCNFSDKNCQ